MDLTLKAKATKAKINKCDYITLISFCTTNETINKMKRQPTEPEQILAYPTANTRFVSKIYEEFIQLNSKKIIQLKNE